MILRRQVMFAIVMLFVSVVVQLVAGIIASFQENWMMAGPALVGAALANFYAMSALLGLTLNTRLTQLEEQFPGSHPVLGKRDLRIGKCLGVCMVILVPTLLSLSIVAGWRQDWPWMGIYLVACAIVGITCMNAMFIVGADVRLRRLQG